MKITFCGHSKINVTEKEKIATVLLENIKLYANNQPVEFLLGMYGSFDIIAAQCCKEYKKQFTASRLIFVTPYLDEKYLKNRDHIVGICDEIVFPPLENVPKRYAIARRNVWLAQEADLVIAYVKRQWGGAAKMLEYVTSHNVPYINIADTTKAEN